MVKIPEAIAQVNRFRGKSKAYLVGGAVRDILMGIEPKDFDFAVDGKGVQFGRRFARSVRGTFVLLSTQDDDARVVKGEYNFDFNGLGNQGLEHNLARRDFTVNALAIDLDDQNRIIDPFSGLKHLETRRLHPASEASLKLDPLRLLRGFRFAAELDFRLTPEFFRQAAKVTLGDVAAERISYELMRIISTPDSFPHVVQLDKLGVFRQIMPEARPLMKDRPLWKHALATFEAVERLMKDNRLFKSYDQEFEGYFSLANRRPLTKLGGLLHDIAKPHTQMITDKGELHFYGHDAKGARLAETIGHERLKLSRDDVDVLTTLVREHMRLHLLATNKDLTDRAIRRFFRDLGDQYFGAMLIAWADGFATAGRTRHLEKTFARMLDLKRADESKPKIDRLINGHDLIEKLKIEPGPIFKIILNEVLDQQLEGKITTKTEAMKLAREVYKANKPAKQK